MHNRKNMSMFFNTRQGVQVSLKFNVQRKVLHLILYNLIEMGTNLIYSFSIEYWLVIISKCLFDYLWPRFALLFREMHA